MGSKKTILVVDDIPLMRTMLVKYVQTLAHKISSSAHFPLEVEVIEAPNGKVAIETLKERPVNLVFLDMMMPEMDGLTFLSVKKTHPEIATVPVIVCSAVGEKETVERARELGANAYITKPFTMKSIEEKFREAVTTYFK
ncbi:MAG: response regulator [Planctomycetes bacterium]|nr:response regulator [Planctomycetota bacterium]